MLYGPPSPPLCSCLLQQQEAAIADGRHRRIIGTDVVEQPDYVACTAVDIAVSDRGADGRRVTLLSRTTGTLLTRYTNAAVSKSPCSLRFLGTGDRLAVAEGTLKRVSVLTVASDALTLATTLDLPVGASDVVECDDGHAVLVVSFAGHCVLRVPLDGERVSDVIRGRGTADDGDLNYPTAAALLPPRFAGGSCGLVVLDRNNDRFQVFNQ